MPPRRATIGRRPARSTTTYALAARRATTPFAGWARSIDELAHQAGPSHLRPGDDDGAGDAALGQSDPIVLFPARSERRRSRRPRASGPIVCTEPGPLRHSGEDDRRRDAPQ